MREVIQPRAHFIHLALHVGLHLAGQGIEGSGKGRRPDSQRGSRVSPGLAGGELAGGDFVAGFVELGFDFVG